MARDAKKRKSTNILQAYRLLSRNVVVVDSDHVGVRFETFFSAKYQDRFYVICEFDVESGHFSVWKHTLPSFVPVKHLEKDHLNQSFDVSVLMIPPHGSLEHEILTLSTALCQDFLDVVEEQLQMYVSRKEQTLELKREYPTATVRSNAAYNFVHISVPYKNK